MEYVECSSPFFWDSAHCHGDRTVLIMSECECGVHGFCIAETPGFYVILLEILKLEHDLRGVVWSGFRRKGGDEGNHPSSVMEHGARKMRSL